MGTLSLTKEARIYNGGKTVSLINGAGKTGQLHIKRMKLEHFLPPHKKINSKLIKDLNVRPETTKLLEGNTPYDPPPRVMEIKTKINKWGPIK